ncbi:hypothetical protein DIPPA_27235 [Diplonema papillatum]|nr:hypothetical protein DIPPA_27235 [Diplonema papillatum]
MSSCRFISGGVADCAFWKERVDRENRFAERCDPLLRDRIGGCIGPSGPSVGSCADKSSSMSCASRASSRATTQLTSSSVNDRLQHLEQSLSEEREGRARVQEQLHKLQQVVDARMTGDTPPARGGQLAH